MDVFRFLGGDAAGAEKLQRGRSDWLSGGACGGDAVWDTLTRAQFERLLHLLGLGALVPGLDDPTSLEEFLQRVDTDGDDCISVAELNGALRQWRRAEAQHRALANVAGARREAAREAAAGAAHRTGTKREGRGQEWKALFGEQEWKASAAHRSLLLGGGGRAMPQATPPAARSVRRPEGRATATAGRWEAADAEEAAASEAPGGKAARRAAAEAEGWWRAARSWERREQATAADEAVGTIAFGRGQGQGQGLARAGSAGGGGVSARGHGARSSAGAAVSARGGGGGSSGGGSSRGGSSRGLAAGGARLGAVRAYSSGSGSGSGSGSVRPQTAGAIRSGSRLC